MRQILRWGLRGLTAACATVLALWLATRGTYPVPALVTQDDSVPAVTLAGHRLHLRIVEGPPDAATVIVLHGGPGGDFHSLEALAALSDMHRVVFYDQRGAGLSERVAARALTLDGHLDELGAVIEHVAPGRPVILLGHSWGAMLATAYLGRHPSRISRAVLIEPGYLDARGRDRWREASRRFLSGPGYAATAVLTGFRAAHVTGPDADAREDFLIGRMVHAFANHPGQPYHCGAGYGAPMRRFGALSSAAWDDASDKEVDRIAQGAARYQGPVLLIAGACNSWLGATLQAQHRERFRDADMAVIPNAGHDVVWDNPTGTLSALRAFLGRPGAEPGL